MSWLFFFFNDTATTEIYTLSLHDALPICDSFIRRSPLTGPWLGAAASAGRAAGGLRSEEHTSELQSQSNLVCRLLLEKKKNEDQLYARHHQHDHPLQQRLLTTPDHSIHRH